MKIWVLDNIPVATERSRRDLSIGEVKFDVRIDYLSQKPFQSIGSIEFLEGPSPYPENTAPRGSLEVQKKPIQSIGFGEFLESPAAYSEK